MRPARIVTAALWLAVIAGGAVAQARKPKLPPGRDPGGLAVAAVTAGLDYTDAAVARRLARDGEGDLIGWDASDGDNRPYRGASVAEPRWDEGGEQLIAAVVAAAPLRLVPIRIGEPKPAVLARALSFAAATPAPIVLVPIELDGSEAAAVIVQAAARYPALTIVVGAAWAASATRTQELPINIVTVSGPHALQSDVIVVPETGRDTGVGANGASPASILAAFVRAMGDCASSQTRTAIAAHPRLRRLAGMLTQPANGAIEPCRLRF